VFNSYALPQPRRREGPAAALSFLAHIAIADSAWRGAVSRAGARLGPSGAGEAGGGRGRWFALPATSAAQAHEFPQPPAVTVPTIAVPASEPVKIDVPRRPSVIAPPPSAAVGSARAPRVERGKGRAPGAGAARATGTGVGADSGAGSGGNASDIFPASPRWTIFRRRAHPRTRGRRHEVRFWVTPRAESPASR